MSLQSPVSSDHQLARLLQIGVVLEEVVEARANHHLGSLSETERDAIDPEIEALLDEASAESADHRRRIEALVEQLDAETVPYEEIEALVEAQYTAPDDFDGVLYDQLCNEETAYKFYDDLIEAIERGETNFSIDRDEVLSVLRELRAEEEAGVEEVTEVMEERR